jgi:hypothetical protein
MVAIAQDFEMPDLKTKGEVKVLIPSKRIIPDFGVVIGDGDKDEKEQAIERPCLP